MSRFVDVINNAGYAVPVWDISKDTHLFRYKGAHYRVKKGDVEIFHPERLGDETWRKWVTDAQMKFSDELYAKFYRTFQLAKFDDVKAKAIEG